MGSPASGHRRALNVFAFPEDINRSSGPFSSPMHASARAAERRRSAGAFWLDCPPVAAYHRADDQPTLALLFSMASRSQVDEGGGERDHHRSMLSLREGE